MTDLQPQDAQTSEGSTAATVDLTHGEGDDSGLPVELTAAIEAVLMVAERPIEPRLLAQLVETSVEAVEATCAELDATYREQGRGFVLARVAGGYRYQSHPEQAAYVERFVLEGQSSRLSAAALETMAIVAYKQPVSRAQVAAIRGVSVDAVMRTLTQRGYIAEVSRDSGPGQAVMYGTTALFLERLNIDSIVDLPELGEFVPNPDVVEALEHGLRFDPAEVNEVVEAAETSEPEAPLAEKSADEVFIDLRDSVTGYQDPRADAEE